MSNKEKPYLPNERSWYEPSKESLVSKSPEGIDTVLPNPVEDPIVANNICNSEFDYTEDPFTDSTFGDDLQ